MKRLIALWKALVAFYESLTVQATHADVIDDRPQPPPVVTPVPGEPSATPTPTSDAYVAANDALDLSKVKHWIVKNWTGASGERLVKAKVTAKISEAWTDGNMLHTRYEYPDSWMKSEDGVVNAVACFFYSNGDGATGGKFDWWRTGGQSSKTLENVHKGYGGHKMPPKGRDCWTMIASIDSGERSNTCHVEWR